MPDDSARREYPKPPIEEALVQVTFAEPLAWNVATPGVLFERFRLEYPQEPVAQEQLQAEVQLQVEVQIPGGAQVGPNFALNRGAQRYIYKDDSQHRLVVVNPLTLSANSLRPYEGWPALRERFRSAALLTGEVAPLKPVRRVALRYINRVKVPGPRVDTDDYFNLVVRTAENGQATFRGFMHRVESVLADNETVIVFTFASLAPEQESQSVDFLLDLEVYRDGLDLHSLEEITQVADALKRIENDEFESCIKEPARELFT